MGCSSSKASQTGAASKGVTEPVGANPETVELLRNCWKKVEEDLDSNGAKFFLKVFKLAPPALALFPFKDDPVLEESIGLRAHGRIVFRTIGRLVAAGNDLSKVMPELESVGRAHAKYNVTENVFEIMEAALMDTLKEIMGGEWSAALEAAWKDLYYKLSRDIIMVGVSKAKDHVPDHSKLEDQKKKDIALVRKSWTLVTPKLEENGVKFFLKVFEVAPPAIQVFPFRNETDLANSPGLKAHSRMVFRTIGRVVDGLHEPSAIVPELQSIGVAHSKFGVSASVFEAMKQALVITLKDVCADGWDDETEEAWKRVYDWMAAELVVTK